MPGARPATRSNEPSRRTPHRLLPPFVGTVLAGAALVVLGVPGALALGSAGLLAAATARVAPGMRGAASWAAGVVLEVGLVVGMSAALALVSPRLHGQAVHLALLASPALLATTVILLTRRSERGTGGHPWQWQIPALVTAAVLAVAGAVATRGPLHDIAWAMSGDARNHVAIMRGLLHDGGLTLDAVRAYPAAVNTIGAVLAGAGDRSGSAGQVILNDAGAMATTYLLAAIAIGVLLAGAVIECSSSVDAARITWPTRVTALVAASGAGSPLVLGTAITDGFLSGYGALALALSAVVLALRVCGDVRHGLVPFVLLVAATGLTFASWTILAVVPAALTVLTTVLAVATLRTRRPAVTRADRASALGWWLAIAGGVALLGGIALTVSYAWDRLVAVFVNPGASRAPHAMLLVVLGLMALGSLFGAPRGAARRRTLVPVVAAAAGGAVLIWLLRLPGDGVTWSYYAQKTHWLVSASLLWVPFAAVAQWVTRVPPSRDAAPRWRAGLAAGASASAVLVILGTATAAPEPLRAAASGWDLPTAEAVGEAVEAADTGEPYILWNLLDPGNDRLGNFWAVLAWGSDPSGEYLDLPSGPDAFVVWAYMATGQIPELCTLVADVPGIDIYTTDRDLGSELRTTCPGAVADVLVQDEGQ